MRFSQLVQDINEATSVRYNNMVYELQQAGHDITVLSLGEAFFDLPLLSMETLPREKIFHYSHSRGIMELRQALVRYYLRDFGVNADPATEILVTAGSKVAIYMAFLAVLNPGDEVLIPEPAWVSYCEQIRLCQGVPVGVPFDVGSDQLEAYVTPRTRAIVINTPHNPRGRVYTEHELRCLVELAQRRGLWIFCDEAYSDFVDDGSFVSIGKIDKEKSCSVIFNSISKNHGMSGWRIGYLMARPELIYQVLKLNQHLITCPPTILCHYVARYFEQILAICRPQIREVVAKRRAVTEHMTKIGLQVLPGSATFYTFVSIAPSTLGSEEFCTRLLTERHISAVPGIGYGQSCDQFIRVSVGTESLARIRAALEQIKDLIARTSARQRQAA